MSNVEVQLHGHDRTVGLFNCVARFLDFAFGSARNDREEGGRQGEKGEKEYRISNLNVQCRSATARA